MQAGVVFRRMQAPHEIVCFRAGHSGIAVCFSQARSRGQEFRALCGWRLFRGAFGRLSRDGSLTKTAQMSRCPSGFSPGQFGGLTMEAAVESPPARKSPKNLQAVERCRNAGRCRAQTGYSTAKAFVVECAGCRLLPARISHRRLEPSRPNPC